MIKGPNAICIVLATTQLSLMKESFSTRNNIQKLCLRNPLPHMFL